MWHRFSFNFAFEKLGEGRIGEAIRFVATCRKKAFVQTSNHLRESVAFGKYQAKL